jgi:hypothetical protein
MRRSFTADNTVTAGTGLTSWEVDTNYACGSTDPVNQTWTMNYDHGANYRENGFNCQYETKTTATTAGALEIYVAPQYNQTTIAEGDEPQLQQPNFGRLRLETNGSAVWTGTCTTTTNGTSLQDWMTESNVDRLFEPLTEKQKKDPKMVELYNARRKSEKLLKMMLSTKEYYALKKKGEVEIPNPDDKDVIFIVKKNPNSMVEKRIKGKTVNQQCIVTKPEHDFLPHGDRLLQKILLIKSDPKKFEEIAIAH